RQPALGLVPDSRANRNLSRKPRLFPRERVRSKRGILCEVRRSARLLQRWNFRNSRGNPCQRIRYLMIRTVTLRLETVFRLFPQRRMVPGGTLAGGKGQ